MSYLEKLMFDPKPAGKAEAPKLKDMIKDPIQQAVLGEKIHEKYTADNPGKSPEEIGFEVGEIFRRFAENQSTPADIAILNDLDLRHGVAEASALRTAEKKQKLEEAEELRNGIRPEDIQILGKSSPRFAPYAGLLEDNRTAKIFSEHLYNLYLQDDPDAIECLAALRELKAARANSTLIDEEADARLLVKKYNINRDDYKILKAGNFTEDEYQRLKNQREDRAEDLKKTYSAATGWLHNLLGRPGRLAKREAEEEMTTSMGKAGDTARALARERAYEQKGSFGKFLHRWTGGKTSKDDVRDIMKRIGNIENSTAADEIEKRLPAFAEFLAYAIEKDENLVSGLLREVKEEGEVKIAKWDAPEQQRHLSSKADLERKKRDLMDEKKHQSALDSWVRNPAKQTEITAAGFDLKNPAHADGIKDMFTKEHVGAQSGQARTFWDRIFDALFSAFATNMKSKLRMPTNI